MILAILVLPQMEGEIGKPTASLAGDFQDALYGWNVSGAGDVNGDGFKDIIVGAPDYDDRGKVYIFFGGPWFKGDLVGKTANVTINGSADGDRFGWDVSYAGDLNNDNFADVIVGAPGNGTNRGAVYIFLGNDSLPLFLKDSSASVIFTGQSSGDEFGTSVSDAGDVNNDGFDDIVVGAPGYNNHTGSAHILLGKGSIAKSLEARDADLMFWGTNFNDNFGFSVSSAGKVNKDQYDDVIIGAPGADSAFIYFGGDPMNTWIETTETDFNSAEIMVHINTKKAINGEAQLADFHNIKAMAAYYDGSNPPDTPEITRNRTWNQEIWTDETQAQSMGIDANHWFLIESGTVRKNEKIMAVSDAGLDIIVQISDGLSWDHTLELIDVVRDNKYPGFDITYESLSGDALIAYYNNTSPTKLIPKYRIWNGTEWSAEMDTLPVGTADIQWLVLASNPLSNEIIMVTLDRGNKDIYAQVWDGSEWGNVTVIETQASRDDCQCFDVIYEHQSGNGIIVWGGDSGSNKNLNRKTWKGINGNWSEPQIGLVAAKNQVNWVRLAADPKSNHVILGVLDNGREITAQIWNGSSWNPQFNVTGSAERNGERCFDVAWETKSDKEGLIVYGIGDHRPAYRTISDTIISEENFTLDALPPNNGRKPNWIVLKNDPQSSEIMLMYLVDDGGGNGGAEDDIGVQLWNGSDWKQPYRVEFNSTRDDGQSFDFAFTDTCGYFISKPFNSNYTAPWGRIGWTADIPSGTDMKIRTRTSSDGFSWSVWSGWYENGDRITSPKNQWIQYQVYFETTNVSLTPVLHDLNIELNRANLTVLGNPGDNFGWSLSKAGDLDGDGYGEVIIGAPLNNNASGSGYIFNGSYIKVESSNDRCINLLSGESANVTLCGSSSGDLFGYSVSYGGNLNFDGYPDVIVGAPNTLSNGSVYVFFGSPYMVPNYHADFANFTVHGERSNDGFGWSVSWCGNLDNGTLDSLAVGAPFYDNGMKSNSGKTYIYSLYSQPDLHINNEIDDEYQEIPSGNQVNITYVTPGNNASFQINLENDGFLKDTFDFNISSYVLSGWTWALKENITSSLILDGHSIALNPGETRDYTLNISSPIMARHNEESWIVISITSQNETLKKDAVMAFARTYDITPPELSDLTMGNPSTDDPFIISASITDNVMVNVVELNYWFDLSGGMTDGPYNVSMNPGLVKSIDVPSNAIKLYYNISANDSSGNWNYTGETEIDILDDDLPSIIDTTSDLPTTGDTFSFTAIIIDNIQVDSVHLHYRFDISSGGTDGPYNLSMNPGYIKSIIIPSDAIKLYYNILANDSSGNWNQTNETEIDVLDDDSPSIIDTTFGLPTTQDVFIIQANITDNIQVGEVNLFFWFDLFGGGTVGPYNVSMDPGFAKSVDVPFDAIRLHYNISAKDSSGNWNQTSETEIDVLDDDPPSITDITFGLPTTQDIFIIQANITDNIQVGEVNLFFWFDLYGGGTDGPFNVTMDPGYTKAMNVPSYAIKLYYNISVIDSNGNWIQTGETEIDVLDDDQPSITDTTSGIPTTGDIFNVSANVTDNTNVGSVYLYYWFDLFGGGTSGPYNVTMDPEHLKNLIVPWNAITFNYNILAMDIYDNWNETATRFLDIHDNDSPIIFNVSVDPTIQITGEQVNVTVIVSDNYELGSVWLNVTYPNGSLLTIILDETGSDSWFLDRMFSDTGEYIFEVCVTDNFGNSNHSTGHVFTIIPQPTPAIDYIQIRSEPNGEGEILQGLEYHVNEMDEFYAAGYNVSLGYLGDVNVDWISNNQEAGILDPGYGNQSIFRALNTGSGVVYAIYGIIENSSIFEVIATPEPTIVDKIPDMDLFEDFGIFRIDLSRYAHDNDDSKSEMMWYLTGINSSIVYTYGENVSGNHILTLLSMKDRNGNMKITYWLVDSEGHTSSQDAWINITAVNDAPSIVVCPDIFVHYDSSYSFDYTTYISDIDNAQSELTLMCDDPTYITINDLVVTYGYPESMVDRMVYVVLTISDGIESDSQMIKVTVTSDYPPVTVSKIPDVSLYENQTLSALFDLDNYIMDPDGDSLYMSYGYSHINISIQEDHTVDFSAPGEWNGEEKVTFRAQDPTGAIVEQTITVTVIPVNDPPVIKPLPSLVVHHDSYYLFDLFWYVSDNDNEMDDLVITTSEPNLVSVNETSIILLYPESLHGQHFPYNRTLTIYVSDGIDTVFRQITVFVGDDHPPQRTKKLDDVFFNEDESITGAFQLDDYFVDIDSDTIFYSSGNVNIQVLINQDHTVDFSAPANWFGIEYITIRATDDEGAFAEDTLVVTILPVNDAPMIDEVPLQIGERGKTWVFDLNKYLSDIDNDLRDLRIFVNSTHVTVIGHILIFNYTDNITHETVWITVTDGELLNTVPVEVSIVSPSGSSERESWLWYLITLILITSLLLVIAIKRGHYNIEDIFLITTSGLLVHHVGKPKDLEEEQKDEDILASMFVAVQQFIMDAFASGGDDNLKRMDYGDKTVMIYKGDYMLLSVFINGQATKALYEKMEEFVVDSEELYKEHLERLLDGHVQLPHIDETLSSFLEGNYSKGEWKDKID
jgi:hypothetical protein